MILLLLIFLCSAFTAESFSFNSKFSKQRAVFVKNVSHFPTMVFFAEENMDNDCKGPTKKSNPFLKRLVSSITASICVVQINANDAYAQNTAPFSRMDVPTLIMTEAVDSIPFLKLPSEQSKLLTTTVRSSNKVLSSAQSNSFLKEVFPDQQKFLDNLSGIISGIPAFVTSYSAQLFAAGASAIVLADRLQTASDLAVIVEEQARNITLLSEQLKSIRDKGLNDTPTTAFSADIPYPLTEQLQYRLEQLSNRFEERGKEIQRLQNTLQKLKEESTVQPERPSKVTESSHQFKGIIEKLETESLRYKNSAERNQQSVKQLLDAVKILLVKKKLLAQGLANMLLPSTAAETLLTLAEKSSLTDSDAIREIEIQNFQKTIADLQSKLQVANDASAEAKEQTNLLVNQLRESQSAASKWKKELDSTSSAWSEERNSLLELQEKLEQKLAAKETAEKQLQLQISEYQSIVKNAESKLQILTASQDKFAEEIARKHHDSLNEQKSKLTAAQEQLAKTQQELNAKISSLSNDLMKKENILISLQQESDQKITALSESKDAALKQVDILRSELGQLQKRLTEKEYELQEAQSQVASANSEKSEVNPALFDSEEFSTKLLSKDREIDELKQLLERSKNTDGDSKLEAARAMAKELNAKLQDKSREVEELKKQLESRHTANKPSPKSPFVEERALESTPTPTPVQGLR